MKTLTQFSVVLGALVAGGASAAALTSSAPTGFQTHANEASCPGFCYTCGALPLTYAVVPMDHEFSNDADESVACGHHVECRGCLVSSTLVDTLIKAIGDDDHALIARRMSAEEGWRIRLNRDRSALQLLGCDSTEVTTHLSLAPGTLKTLTEALSASGYRGEDHP